MLVGLLASEREDHSSGGTKYIESNKDSVVLSLTDSMKKMMMKYTKAVR